MNHPARKPEPAIKGRGIATQVVHRFSKVHVRDLEDDIWWSGDAETDVPTSAPVTQVILEEARC